MNDHTDLKERVQKFLSEPLKFLRPKQLVEEVKSAIAGNKTTLEILGLASLDQLDSTLRQIEVQHLRIMAETLIKGDYPEKPAQAAAERIIEAVDQGMVSYPEIGLESRQQVFDLIEASKAYQEPACINAED